LGINGFGGIGGNITGALLDRDTDVELAAVNDLRGADELAHLLKNGSVHGARIIRYNRNLIKSDHVSWVWLDRHSCMSEIEVTVERSGVGQVTRRALWALPHGVNHNE
jgi:glyceraldehyde-3-phosphate dehydrogenase/erythrose-4-phosphate dehydrogenase